MELDPNLALLMRSLKVDDPWVPPKTWESIPSESGAAPSVDHGQNPSDSILDTSLVSEAILVQLILNALQGVKSSLIVIDKLSTAFCLSPADRTSHQVPNLWHRLSSPSALGKILKSIRHSGLVFFFLQKFVNFYLALNPNAIVDRGGRGTNPPYSLVNQAFATAVRKVLEGYICALDTLLASVKLRRSMKSADAPTENADRKVSLTSVALSEITVLEVYLHTKELRTRIEVLGNICFHKVRELYLSNPSGDGLTTDADMEFHDFPRGAELLTYLYVQLRDADPVHRELLKFLFVHSCEPYCGFINSWIYHASIDDPYEEFFVFFSDHSLTSNVTAGSLGNISLASVKERNVSVPCFLKDVCRPLIRAGQQLQVLVKLLNLCNFAILGCNNFEGTCVSCDLANLEHILPYWGGTLNDSSFSLYSLSFSRKDLRTLKHKREIYYRKLLEKLHVFFTQLKIRHQQMNHVVKTTLPGLLDKQRGVTIPSLLVSDSDMILSTTTKNQGATDLGRDQMDTDASSTFEMDPFNSSECSSLSSSEEDTIPEEVSELPDVVSQPTNFLLSTLSPSYVGRSALQNSSETKRSSAHYSHQNSEGVDPKMPIVNQHHENVKRSSTYVHIRSSYAKCMGDGYQSGRCWPLGGLQRNPFSNHMKYRGLKQLPSMDCGPQVADGNIESVEAEKLDFGGMFVSCNSDPSMHRRAPLMRGMYETSPSSSICRSWNTNDTDDLSMNPNLTKSAGLRTWVSSKDRGTFNNLGSFLSYFDFSSVVNPWNANSESEASSCIDVAQVEAPFHTDSSVAMVHERIKNSYDFVKDDMTDQTILRSVCSTRKENFVGDQMQNVFGGADWERALRYPGDSVTLTTGDMKHSLLASFDVPLDIIIDKCILQEILLQYKYVSDFTIKLLEEGFDLHEHLLVLQRYHFMELADWADSFVFLLRSHKWHGTEPEERITEIQGLLDLALQRSSCESDHYRDRLFVYTKEQSVASWTISTTGVHAFDFIALGYRVDWPVSIVLPPNALKIYAEIFSYLIQIRLAVFSLTDVWHFLKNLMHSNHDRCIESSKMKDFKILIEMRQQINHFVSTLQQYVHSQLSHVSWYRFQGSLKHQVKDMLDLESVHMSYLDEALHMCFLTGETEPLAAIIENILQCAIDFRSCLTGGMMNLQSDGADSSNLLSHVNFSQVFAIKATFEKNLKGLYLLYLRSPKHGDFSLCRFWSCLNFNDYYFNMLSEGVSFL